MARLCVAIEASSGSPRWASSTRALALALIVCQLAIALSLHGGVGACSGDDYTGTGRSREPPVVRTSRVTSSSPRSRRGFCVSSPRLFGDRDEFRRALLWTMAAADLAIALCQVWGFGSPTALVYLVITGLPLTLYFMRSDLLPTAGG